MSISFVCPFCGSKEVLLDKMAGRDVICSECGKPFRVDGVKAASPPETASVTLADLLEEIRKLRRTIVWAARIRMAVSLVIFLLGAALCIWGLSRAEGLLQNAADHSLQGINGADMKKLQDLIGAP
jgi:hypothetical protein